MKASDIPDEVILGVVREFNEGRQPPKSYPPRTVWPGTTLEFTIPAWTREGPMWCLIFDLEERLPDYPRKVILAKCRALVRRRLLDGCTCGCRGDFEIPGTTYPLPSERRKGWLMP